MLNRVISRTGRGWELEADLRHAELIVQQLGLVDGKTVITPGVDMPEASAMDEDEDEEEALSPEQATMYRFIGARCNYLQPDRPDIQYATKEVCRIMAKPTPRAWEMLKRIGRYLKGRPRLVWRYDWQTPQDTIDVTSDANWAGCRRSRKSTSGGTVQIGTHLLKTYSKTQAVVAKSSGESLLYGVVRASTESLGISSLFEDFGEAGLKVRVGMDATAAMGIVQRRGLSKFRHVEVDVLWVQKQQARRLLPLKKVLGTKNPSDMMTKNVPSTAMELYLDMLNLKFEGGRAKIAQKLHSMGEIKGQEGQDSPLASAHPCVGVQLLGKVGGQRDARANASSGVGDLLPEVVGGSGAERHIDRLHFNNCVMPRLIDDQRAEDRHVDSWGKQGQGGRWTRVHRSARRSLLTPSKVAGGPGKLAGLKKIRITRGRYFNSGKAFKIIDDWTVRSHAHRMLKSSWIGTTDFRETVECIDDDDDDDDNDEKEGIDDEKNIGDEKKLKWADQEFEEIPRDEVELEPHARVAPPRTGELNAQRRDGKCAVGDQSDRHFAAVALCDRGGVLDVHRLYRPKAGRPSNTGALGRQGQLAERTAPARATYQV